MTSNFLKMSDTLYYDYIIAGAGAAGLNLALAIRQKPALAEKSILILEKDAKNQLDRTWCLWEKQINPLEHIFYKQWNMGVFYGKNITKTLNFAPYRYKMLQSIDFYRYARQQLSQYPHTFWKQAQITGIENDIVYTNTQTYKATYIFNSISQLDNFKIQKPYILLLQHFKGWYIRAEKPIFNPDKMTYMDFRIHQHNDCRFFYVLPFNEQEALVEYTIFSDKILNAEAYQTELSSYVNQYLNIKNYEILHEEFGVIPMTDFIFPTSSSPFCINIGSYAGQTKPSTGYTFLRTQQHAKKIVNQLAQGLSPVISPTFFQKRFSLYDSVMLDVLLHNRCEARLFFDKLFEKNPVQRVFAFLDEETSFREELAIMWSVPTLAASFALLHQIIR